MLINISSTLVFSLWFIKHTCIFISSWLMYFSAYFKTPVATLDISELSVCIPGQMGQP